MISNGWCSSNDESMSLRPKKVRIPRSLNSQKQIVHPDNAVHSRLLVAGLATVQELVVPLMIFSMQYI